MNRVQENGWGVCREYSAKGWCKYGLNCKYKHVNVEDVDEYMEANDDDDDGSRDDEFTFSDNSSTESFNSHTSAWANDLSRPSVQKTFLLNTYDQSHGITSQKLLQQFVQSNKQTILNTFQTELSKIYAEKSELYAKSATKQFEDVNFQETKNALDTAHSVCMDQLGSFQAEMQRLASINNADATMLASAYAREFAKANARLPFYAYRTKIIETLMDNDVVVVVGETGSGKTTQVPQYLLEAGMASGRKKIVCIQPRKIAAINVAKRISHELNCEHTRLVTYKVFDNNRNKPNHLHELRQNKLVFMSDKMLLHEYRKNKNLTSYSCVIVDEAHERTLFTDILLCELKKLVKKRRLNGAPLKLIIMSATIDEKKFSDYFDACPIVQVRGRQYPIETFYEKESRADYTYQAVEKVHFTVKIYLKFVENFYETFIHL